MEAPLLAQAPGIIEESKGAAGIAFINADQRLIERSLDTLRIKSQAPSKTIRCKLSGAQLDINIAKPERIRNTGRVALDSLAILLQRG